MLVLELVHYWASVRSVSKLKRVSKRNKFSGLHYNNPFPFTNTTVHFPALANMGMRGQALSGTNTTIIESAIFVISP